MNLKTVCWYRIDSRSMSLFRSKGFSSWKKHRALCNKILSHVLLSLASSLTGRMYLSIIWATKTSHMYGTKHSKLLSTSILPNWQKWTATRNRICEGTSQFRLSNPLLKGAATSLPITSKAFTLSCRMGTKNSDSSQFRLTSTIQESLRIMPSKTSLRLK